ncbi:preprotein translocase subunit YajC, partial [Rhodovulum sulfidophilum]|nr:preprotein translocase subunit YajC [Rhodovulum sulfidophilum]
IFHEDGIVDVEIADGVKVRVMKSTIVQVMSKTEPAAA